MSTSSTQIFLEFCLCCTELPTEVLIQIVVPTLLKGKGKCEKRVRCAYFFQKQC